jgi:hypothetical protein
MVHPWIGAEGRERYRRSWRVSAGNDSDPCRRPARRLNHDGIPDPVRLGDRRRHVDDRLPDAKLTGTPARSIRFLARILPLICSMASGSGPPRSARCDHLAGRSPRSRPRHRSQGARQFPARVYDELIKILDNDALVIGGLVAFTGNLRPVRMRGWRQQFRIFRRVHRQDVIAGRLSAEVRTAADVLRITGIVSECLP